LDEAKAAVCQNEENPSGNLNIGAPESVLKYRLPPILKAFREQYPNVRLSLRPDQLTATRQKLDDGRVDLIFIIDEPIHDQNLCVDDLGVEPVVVVGPSDHVLARRKKIVAADLQDETLLLTDAGCCYRQRFEQALIAAKVHPKSLVEYSSIEAIKKCVASGMGIGVLPQISVRTEMRNGTLALLRWKGPSLTMRRQLVWRRTKWISPAFAAFRKTLAVARPE
jgi:DNA-binding transcriptional LysR family regulator